jgi:hypothetical protein
MSTQHKPKSPTWTRAEVAVIEARWSTHTWQQIAELLPNRTPAAVEYKVGCVRRAAQKAPGSRPERIRRNAAWIAQRTEEIRAAARPEPPNPFGNPFRAGLM